MNGFQSCMMCRQPVRWVDRNGKRTPYNLHYHRATKSLIFGAPHAETCPACLPYRRAASVSLAGGDAVEQPRLFP